MSAEWKECTIGEVCCSVSNTYLGHDKKVVLINTSDVFDGDILCHECVPNNNLRGQFKKTFIKNDILYSEIRPANKRYAYVDFENTSNYIASTKLMVIRAKKEKIKPRFLYFLLKSKDIIHQLQIRAETRSGTFPQITFGAELATIKIKLPLIDIQDKIVSILLLLDNKIESNKRANNILQQQAEMLFADYFLRFDSIPSGWRKGNLLDIADYTNGLAMQRFRPSDNEVGLPVLKIKELRQGFCDYDSEQCSPTVNSNYIVYDGDVIFSWSGSLLVDFWCGGKCGLNQHLFKVTSSRFDSWFTYSWTNYHLAKFIAIAADKATTMGHIKREDLAKSEVLIPSEEDYKNISDIISPLYSRVICNRIENRRLATLRDTLLPKLMSGEIDVLNVQI